MARIDEIPPEILGVVFEIGIHASGIRSLVPLLLVCRNWRDIANSTPRLWGIIAASKQSSPASLEKQIAKAKASPLSLTIENIAQNRKFKVVMERLRSLSENWVNLQVGTDFLAGLHLADLHSLRNLTLSNTQRFTDDSQEFFSRSNTPALQSQLQYFEALTLPKQWIIDFLGPSLLFLRIVGNFQAHSQNPKLNTGKADIGNTWSYLSRARNAITIELENITHYSESFIRPPPTIHLQHLTNLRLKKVRNWPLLLSVIAAPSLQLLSIDQSDNSNRTSHPRWQYWNHYWHHIPTQNDEFAAASLFSQWSNPKFLPPSLHTLELLECLEVDDIPYFVRWLARLPNLVRLVIQDSENALGKAADTSTDGNLFKALSSPQIWGIPGENQPTWLCPSLMILYIDAQQEIMDLIPIAQARGGRVVSFVPNFVPPARLRRITAHLCVTGEQKDIDKFRLMVDETFCICISCELHIERTSASSCTRGFSSDLYFRLNF